MGIGRFLGMTAILLVGATSVGCLYFGWDEISAFSAREPALEGVRKPLFPKQEKSEARISTVAVTPAHIEPAAPVEVATVGAPTMVAALGPVSDRPVAKPWV